MRWRSAAWFHAHPSERVFQTRSNSHSLDGPSSWCITETDHDHDHVHVRLGGVNLFRFRASGRRVEPENRNSSVSPIHRRKRRKGETRVKGQSADHTRRAFPSPCGCAGGDVGCGEIENRNTETKGTSMPCESRSLLSIEGQIIIGHCVGPFPNFIG